MLHLFQSFQRQTTDHILTGLNRNETYLRIFDSLEDLQEGQMSETEAMCAKAVAVAKAKNSLQRPGNQQMTPMILEGDARSFPERTDFTILDQFSQFSSVFYYAV